MPFPFKAIFISVSLFAFSPLKASEANTGFKNIIVLVTACLIMEII